MYFSIAIIWPVQISNHLSSNINYCSEICSDFLSMRWWITKGFQVYSTSYLIKVDLYILGRTPVFWERNHCCFYICPYDNDILFKQWFSLHLSEDFNHFMQTFSTVIAFTGSVLMNPVQTIKRWCSLISLVWNYYINLIFFYAQEEILCILYVFQILFVFGWR